MTTEQVTDDKERSRLAAAARFANAARAVGSELESFASLAARLFRCPVGLIGHTDSESVRYLAAVGWKVGAMPRSVALCERALRSGTAVFIEDTARHSELAGHPLVARPPQIRFHASAPLIAADGSAVGTIAVYDREPHSGPHDPGVLELIARQVVSLVERSAGGNVEELRESLRESEERFREFFDNAHDLVVSLDAEGRLLHANNVFFTLLGYHHDDVVRRPLTSLIDPDARAQFEKEYAAITERGEATRIETSFLTSDGRKMDVDGTVNPKVVDGATALARVIFRDVTERKRMAIELEQSRDEALEAARLKSQFLTNVSHEIRTPMNAIVGMLELLLDSDLGDDQREWARTATASADSLLGIINNIIMMSKLEAGKLTPNITDFDPVRTVQQVIDVMQIAIEDRDLEIRHEIAESVPSVLRGDVRRIRIALTNLLSNAVKFTDEGSIVVKVTVERETPTHTIVHFAVTDTGIGVSEEEKIRIFDRFTQADGSLTRRHGGVGLGLSTTRKLVELMGGVIGIDSRVGEGSTFWFTVPFDKPRVERSDASRSRLALDAARVLLCDLSETHARVVQRYLNGWGMDVDSVDRAASVLSELRKAASEERPYRLLVTDLHMPDIDGLALAREVRSDGALRDTGVILLTALGVQIDEGTLRDSGVASALPKPVEQSELFDSVTIAFARSGQPGVMTEVQVEPSAQREPATPAGRAEDGSALRVLLAEDNKLNRKLTMSQLRKLGYDVEAVENGVEAVAALQREKFDVVLMDCQMPEMDGYQATMEIRQQQKNGHRTPIIAMTAHALEGDREKCLAAGMDDYLSKPTRQEELAEALARWTGANVDG